MAMCRGYAPGTGGRKIAHAQRCGALAEPDEEYCAAHLAAAFRKRCAVCRAWLRSGTGPGGIYRNVLCPKGCVQPPAVDEHARILEEMQALNEPELPSTVNGSVKAD